MIGDPLDIRSAQGQGALRRLRGPDNGYGRAHPGLAEFWRSMEHGVLVRPVSSEATACAAELDQWFAGGRPRALLLGEDAELRTALLARWVLGVAASKAAEVVFVPVSRSIGTAIERDMLKLLFGLFTSSASAVFSRPRSPRELMSSIAMALQAAAWVSALPNEQAPRLLVVIDGIERAADGWPNPRARFLSEVGEGVQVLVSARTERRGGGEPSWLEPLGWPSGETACISLPGSPRPLDDAEASARSTTKLFDALSAALAPLSKEDLVGAMGLEPKELEAFESAAPAVRDVTTRREDGKYHQHYLVDARIPPEGTAAFEDAVVTRGLRTLDAPGASVWCEYGIEYLGAHMVRRLPPSSSHFMRLVSPQWLGMWMQRPGALVGFVTDVRRARRVAEQQLVEACRGPSATDAEAERAAHVAAIVRCALVEGSLFAKEGSRAEGDDRSAPYVEPVVDLSKPTGAARERAEALVTLASALSEPENALVGRWASEASAELGEILPRPIPAVVTDIAAVDAERGRRLRAGATHDALGGWLDRDPLIRPSGLSADEAWAIAQALEGESRMVAFAGILPDLPEGRREEAVRESMSAYWSTGGDQALRIVAACGPWLALEDAADVLCAELGNAWTGDFPMMLVGYGSVTELTPVLRRLGGTAALVGAARAIAEVGHWLP